MLKLSGVTVAMIIFLTGCDKVFTRERSVCVTGYNELERGIHKFRLDRENKSGCFGNPPGRAVDQEFGGGGKFACGCKVTPGKKVKLEWEMRQSMSESESGMEAEKHFTSVTIPNPESMNSRYLRVYFMKDGTNPLQWVDDMGAPELSPSDSGNSK